MIAIVISNAHTFCESTDLGLAVTLVGEGDSEAYFYPNGLVNTGNTCYLNASVQSLKAVPELLSILSDFQGGVVPLWVSNIQRWEISMRSRTQMNLLPNYSVLLDPNYPMKERTLLIACSRRSKKKGDDVGETASKKMKMDEDITRKSLLEGEETAWYELVAVITHKGRTSNSGHYVG
jgi:ubiquitin C-terminal hydrolase